MTVPGFPTFGLVLFVLWPVVWSSHLVLSTHHQSRPALLLPWLKWWVVAGLSYFLHTLTTSKVGQNQAGRVTQIFSFRFQGPALFI